MKKRIAPLILALCILTALAAQASAENNVYENNTELEGHWVNWCPSSWQKNAEITSLAETLLSEAGGLENAPRAVHDWICENIYFDIDAFNRGYYDTLSASEVLSERRGVCESIANLVQSLLLEMNIPCIKVHGTAITSDGEWTEDQLTGNHITHTWNEFYINGRFFMMDCSADMGGIYKNGEFIDGTSGSAYFAPAIEEYSKTHKIITRGTNYPVNIPSAWAMDEISNAVNSNLVPVTLLSRYRDTVTEKDLYDALNLDSANASLDSVTRSSAALKIAENLGLTDTEDHIPYTDIANLAEETQNAVYALCNAGIMRGTGENTFSPDALLTRQELICILNRINEYLLKL